MKIFNNKGNSGGGSGGSGKGLSVGDIFMSANMSLSYQNEKVKPLYNDLFLKPMEYPEVSMYAPFNTWGGNLVTEAIPNQIYEGSFLPNASMFDIGDVVITAGNHLKDPLRYVVKVDYKDDREGYIINIALPEALKYASFYDYDGKVHLYVDSVNQAIINDFSLRNSGFVVDVFNKTYEQVTYNNCRIIKTIYDRSISKIISLQFNVVDENDTDYSTVGWYSGDTLSNSTLIQPFNFGTELSYITLATLYTNTTYLNDKRFCYYDETTYDLKDISDNSVIFNIKNTDVTPLDGICIIEKFGNIFVNYAYDLSGVKKVAWTSYNKETSVIRSVFISDLNYSTGNRHDKNGGILLNDVFIGTYEHYPVYLDIAVIFQNLPDENRKAVSFYDGYVFDDISPYKPSFSSPQVWFLKRYGSDINLSEVYNNEYSNIYYVFDNFRTIFYVSSSTISSIHFDGFGFAGYVLFPKLVLSDNYTNYLIVKE